MARFNYFNWLKGANTAVSPFLMPDNALMVQNGCLTSYKLGAIVKDLGYSRVADVPIAKPITGLHNFRQSPTVQKIFRTLNNATGTNLLLQYNNSGAWTDINVGATYDGFENCTVEMEDFIGYCFIVGHDSTQDVFLPKGSVTGTTFSTSANVTNMPQAKYAKRYRDRLYLGNCYLSAVAYPYRVYFSGVPSVGAISWTTGTDFFDVDYSEQVTGLGENWDRFLIFTEYSCYMYDQSQFKKVWDIGCSNHRTIKNAGAYMIWTNRDGVWISTGGRPQNIGGEVIDFIRNAINPSTFFAEVIDEEYHLYVGNVSVNRVSYDNVDLIYNIPTNSWRWRTLYDSMIVFARFNNSGQNRLYMGDILGNIWEKSKYTDSTPIYADSYVSSYSTANNINSHFETKPFDFGEYSLIKGIDNITAYAERAGGLLLKGRVLDKNTRELTPYKPIGQLRSYINNFQVNADEGILLQFEGVESSKNPYWSFFGFSVEITAKSKPKLS